jgi:hypothetical protein
VTREPARWSQDQRDYQFAVGWQGSGTYTFRWWDSGRQRISGDYRFDDSVLAEVIVILDRLPTQPLDLTLQRK